MGCLRSPQRTNQEHKQDTPNVAKARIYHASQAALTKDNNEESTVTVSDIVGMRGHAVNHQMRSKVLHEHANVIIAQATLNRQG